jgi:hypothetical protein
LEEVAAKTHQTLPPSPLSRQTQLNLSPRLSLGGRNKYRKQLCLRFQR